MILSRDTIFELLLKLDLTTLLTFCSSSTQINAICSEPILWQRLLERDFQIKYVGSDAKAKYLRYREIIKFFTPMFPIITDLALKLIDQYIPTSEWNDIKEIYWGNMAKDQNAYPEILDWDMVRFLIFERNMTIDPNYTSVYDGLDYPLGLEITKTVKEHFEQQLKEYERSPLPTVSFWENTIATTPQTIIVRGKPLRIPFNDDLLKFTDRLRYEYIKKHTIPGSDIFVFKDYVSEEFDIDVYTRLVALLE